MELHVLGTSGLQISPVLFGAWAIGGWKWGGTDESQAVSAIHAALDHGITTIDTAPIYGQGRSEEIVGRAVEGRRDSVVIATKCGLNWRRTDGEYSFDYEDGTLSMPVYRNLRKNAVIEECEQSLRRLRTDVIDLYQCHWPDKTTALDETMDAMQHLQQQGKIRAVGVSNFTVEMVLACRQSVPVASVQPRYNLLQRSIEKNIIPYCRKHGIGVIAYSPLQHGLLSGTVTMERTFDADDIRSEHPDFKPERRQEILDRVARMASIAEQYDATPAQLAVAWVLHQPAISGAIVGMRSVAQVTENCVAASLSIHDKDLRQLGDIFSPVN
jgi:methylglyoxal reductase